MFGFVGLPNPVTLLPETGITIFLKSPWAFQALSFFIETLIDTIATQYNVNNERVYACGYSLGGMFSYELACQLNSRITAVASVAGAATAASARFSFFKHSTRGVMLYPPSIVPSNSTA